MQLKHSFKGILDRRLQRLNAKAIAIPTLFCIECVRLYFQNSPLLWLQRGAIIIAVSSPVHN